MTDNSTQMEESRLLDELSKPEPQLTQQELSNSDTVHKTIKRYQHKISEMLKVIQKQKKHNDALKQQLKSLNENLNHMIQKINIKNSSKKQEHPRQQTLKKSLDLEIKKNVAMKKELDVLRAKVKVYEGQRIIDLQDEIRQKDKVIEEQNNTIKMYEKIEKQELNSDIYKKYNQANDKINALNGELLHLKKKLTQAKKHEEQQQKNIKRQHQQLLSLQKKKTTSHSLIKRDEIREQASQAEIKKLKQRLEALESAKKLNEKSFRQEVENLKLKNKTLEVQLGEAKQRIHRKEKEANILTSKMKEISRRSHQTLEPVEKISSHHKSEDITQNSSGLFDHRKEFKGLMHLQGNSRKFDDSQVLPLEKSYKIKSLRFCWFEEHILSLTTRYELPDSKTKEISSFQIGHAYKNIKTSQLTLGDFEYLKEVQIYCGKFIEFIKIRTSRDNLLEVGNDKNYTKCKRFTFDIRNNEKPIAMMGAIQSRKLGENSKQHLISLGLEIKKKEVYTRNKFHPGLRSQSLMKKAASRTGFQQSNQIQNDKNTIPE